MLLCTTRKRSLHIIFIFYQIRPSTDESYCLDSNNVHGNPGSILDLIKCHGLGKGQVKFKAKHFVKENKMDLFKNILFSKNYCY